MRNLGKRFEIYLGGNITPTTSFDTKGEADKYYEDSQVVWDKNRVMIRDKETNKKWIYLPEQFKLW